MRGRRFAPWVCALLGCSGAGQPPPASSSRESSAPRSTTTSVYFAYRDDLDVRARCPSASPLGPGALRGYRLAFLAGPSGGEGQLSVVTVRSDGAVEGLLFAVDGPCLASLEGDAISNGYTRIEQTLERGHALPRSMEEGVQGVVFQRTGATTPPSEGYFTRLVAAWRAAGLATSALDEARAASASAP